jgi:hypothetical protein
MKRIRKVVIHITEKPVQEIANYFTKVIVDGVEYYDSKKEMTHQEAIDLAAKHGLRVLESWEMHRRFIESDEFRKSLAPKWYWCASVLSSYRSNAWQFSGLTGGVDYDVRNNTYGVRCVAKG